MAPGPRRRGKETPITETALKRLIAEQQSFYSTQDQAIQDVRDVLEFTNAVGVDDDYLTTGYVVREAGATDEVIRTGTMLTANPPTLQVTFRGDSTATQTRQTLLEQFTEAGLIQEAGNKGQTYGRVGMGLAQDGAGWSLITWLPDRWDERFKLKPSQFGDDPGFPLDPTAKGREAKFGEAKRRAKENAPFPIKWSYLDPKTVYPTWRGDELHEVLIISERPLWSTLREYGYALDGAGDLVPEELGEAGAEDTQKGHSTIKFCQHWTKRWVTYYLDNGRSGKQVEQWEHGYGFLPIAYSFAYRLPHWTNIKAGWGSAAVMLPAVKYASYLKTLHANQAAASVAPPFARETPMGADAIRGADGNPVESQKILPNVIYNLRPGEKIVPFPQSESNPHLKEQIAMNREELQGLRGPVAQGNLSDAENGFAIEAVKSTMRVKDSPLINGLQSHLEQATRMMWRLIRDKIKEEVVVYREGRDGGSLAVGPAELGENPSVKWDINPESPSAKIVERRFHAEGIQIGIETREEAIVAEGRSPEKVRRDQLKEFLRSTPMYQQAAIAEFAGQIGRGDLPMRYAAAAQTAQTGMVQPAGEPAQAGGAGAGGLPGDASNLTMSPGGQGAAPIQAGQPPTTGVPSSPSVPTAGATAAVQNLGG